MKNTVKIVLAILLFICLFDMPYGYYQFVRLAALVGFAVLAFQANNDKKNTEAILYVGLAILFQPFFKIALGRSIWNIVDVIVAIGLLVTLFINKANENSKN
jgi:hypothetical protein